MKEYPVTFQNSPIHNTKWGAAMKTKKTKKTLPTIEMDSPDPDVKGGATAQSPPKRSPKKPAKTNKQTKPTRK